MEAHEMMNLQDRINRDGITAEATWRDRPPAFAGEWGRGASWYDVTLTFGHGRMTVPFGMGSGHGSTEPTAADVLNCLADDASTYDNAGGFEDWAADLGFDPDSRQAERTYREVERQASALREFLGSEYDAYLYDTERL